MYAANIYIYWLGSKRLRDGASSLECGGVFAFIKAPKRALQDSCTNVTWDKMHFPVNNN